MDNQDFEIDDTEVRKMFAELTSKDRKKVFRKAVKDALNILKKQTITNLRSVINSKMINKKDKHGNSFRKGIKVKVYKDNQSGVIHILGNYKLKFFELGTVQRFNIRRGNKLLKKKRNTGYIHAYHFFKDAKKQKEAEVFNSINRLLVQSITKINNKYK